MKGGRERCSHKGCIQKAVAKVNAKRNSNTLGKAHLCCGLCCPLKKGQSHGNQQA